MTEEGLRRACYVVRFMLASRYDIRNTMYKFYIRVALIGDDEQTTSLWEYRDFDSDYWDKRARGLGATVHIPLASAGDDNSRCKYKDRCVLVGGRLDQCSISRRYHGTITFGH